VCFDSIKKQNIAVFLDISNSAVRVTKTLLEVKII
jgi:hypothetical protein